VLLLDEPCSGLDPNMLARVSGRLRELSDQGATILLIEHNMDVVRALAHYVVFLSEGRALAAGPTEEILGDRSLTKIYFGL
jgi:ABC-type branched-subunit amino acid transport system ATPase component